MSKKKYEVRENESIEACLMRMKEEGYTPIRRIEKPIFQEVMKNDEIIYEPVGRQIIFEAKSHD
ncbi:NETI motif-containing protein [Bacillus rubiinfantis]|uniref:NETI motif-containing protein n=1 Tax=Bacillus rubiinfantis TaxID=1499680 RepID=UPI0005A63F1C|nr:NETI motif-containing protein [Bacillus rubiinfantis]